MSDEPTTEQAMELVRTVRKRVGKSPTQRSLAWLRYHGWTCAVVEHWNPYARIRQDLFGFADIVAIHPQRNGVLAVQTTTTANQAARLAKISANPAAKVWLQAGNAICVHGWRKSRKTATWDITETNVTLEENQPCS